LLLLIGISVDKSREVCARGPQMYPVDGTKNSSVLRAADTVAV